MLCPECEHPITFTGDVKYEVEEKQLANKINPEKVVLSIFLDYLCDKCGTEVLIKRTHTYIKE